MPLPLSSSAKNVLINSISRDAWAPLDYQLFETLTGQAKQRASIIVRIILGVPDDNDSKIVEYGRTYIHDAPDFGCRVARCFFRPEGSAGARFCWRRFSADATDDQIIANAVNTLTNLAHLYRPADRPAAPTQQPLITPPAAPVVPADVDATAVQLSDSELRIAIDRARQQLHDLEMIAVERIAEHERTINMLRGRV